MLVVVEMGWMEWDVCDSVVPVGLDRWQIFGFLLCYGRQTVGLDGADMIEMTLD